MLFDDKKRICFVLNFYLHDSFRLCTFYYFVFQIRDIRILFRIDKILYKKKLKKFTIDFHFDDDNNDFLNQFQIFTLFNCNLKIHFYTSDFELV